MRKILPLLGFLLALAGLLAADEGWRGKPYTEWTGKEVEDVLDHSPWVRQLMLVVLPTLQDRNACPVSEPRCGIRLSPEAAEGVYETQGAGPPEPTFQERLVQQQLDANSTPGASSGGAMATVRWSSSLTVREALVRNRQLRGGIDLRQVQSAGYFEPLDSYIVYVDVRIPLGQKPEFVRAAKLTRTAASKAVLEAKHSGAKAFPARVEPAPMPAYDKRRGVPLSAFYLFFLRQREGQPLLPAGETEAVFECPLGATKIRTVFDLRKMSRQGAPDL